MSQDRFGYEWKKYNAIKQEYRDQYRDQSLNWIHPITTDYFKGKVILDAGCGMGRNSYWALTWGASRLVACDHDQRSVDAARTTLAQFKNAEVFLKDLEDLPWRDEFDFIFSIGVIHHTRDPYVVMKQLHTALKPGGEILLWVYSCEGFEKVLPVLNPIRKYITSKMNLTLLHVLTYCVSTPLYLYLKGFSQKRPYFQQMKRFSFTHVHSILFDQLLPPIARYYAREQARDLLNDFRDVHIDYPPNKNGWIVRGVK